MSERDPRVEPRPGDIVMKSQLFRHVIASTERGVTFSSRCGRQWFNTTFRDTLDDWKEIVKDWEVIHAAD